MLTPDRIADMKAQQEAKQELVIEREQDFKDALNRIFSSSDGQFVAKYLIKYCKVFGTSTQHNMMEDQGKRKVYLELIRPYLDVTIRKDIESL